MLDLISRAMAKEAIRKKFSNISDRCEINEVLNSMPAVDAVPVVHGHWIEIDEGDGDYTYDCSVCGGKWWVAADTTPEENGMKYCPNCGAKMDKEK